MTALASVASVPAEATDDVVVYGEPTFRLGGNIGGLVWNPSLSRLFAFANNTLYSFDSSGSMLRSAKVERKADNGRNLSAPRGARHRIAVSPDGHVAAVLFAEGIYVIDAKSFANGKFHPFPAAFSKNRPVGIGFRSSSSIAVLPEAGRMIQISLPISSIGLPNGNLPEVGVARTLATSEALLAVASDSQIRVFGDARGKADILGGFHQVADIDVSQSHAYVAVVGVKDSSQLLLWDAKKKEPILELVLDRTPLAVRLSDDSTRCAIAFQDHVEVISIPLGKRIATAGVPGVGSALLAFIDADTLVLGLPSGGIRLMTLRKNDEFSAHQGAIVAIWAQGGESVWSASSDGTCRSWTGKRRGKVALESEYVWTDLAGSTEGKWITAVGMDQTLRKLDFNRPPFSESRLAYVPRNPFLSVAVSPDSKKLLAGRYNVGEVVLMDAENGKIEQTYKLSGDVAVVGSVVFLSKSRAAARTRDGNLQVFDLLSGNILRKWNVLCCENDRIISSGDGRRFYATAEDEDSGEFHLKRFDVDTGNSATIVRLSPRTTVVAINRKGTVAVSGDSEGAIRWWNGRDGRNLATSSWHRGPVTSLAFADDDEHVFSGGSDGGLAFWTSRIWKK